jgi:hypothetical protein
VMEDGPITDSPVTLAQPNTAAPTACDPAVTIPPVTDLPVADTPAHTVETSTTLPPKSEHRQATDTASIGLSQQSEGTVLPEVKMELSPPSTPPATHTRMPSRHRRPLSPILEESDTDDVAPEVDTDLTQPKHIDTDSEGEEHNGWMPSLEVAPKPQRTPRPARERRRPARYND